MNDDVVTLEGRKEAETPKAILIEFTNGPTMWCPRSCIVEMVEKDDTVIFTIKEWWCRKNKVY